MIPSARQGLKCGMQWDRNSVHDQTWKGGGGGARGDLYSPKPNYASSPFRIIPRQE